MRDPVKLHYSDTGQGLPVVLLHGFPLGGSIWESQRRQLNESSRVIIPDLRGHGQSPAPTGVYEMEQLARDVFSLLDSLSIEQAVIMGHSMGGYVALAGWQLAPERFLALGLIASQATGDTDEGRENRYKLAAKVAAEGSKPVADAMVPKLFAPTVSGGSVNAALARRLILNTQPAGIIGALKGMAARADFTTLLPAIDVPVLIVAGDQDQIIAPAKAQAMAALIPNATLAPIENAGHMPMLEQPEATTAVMHIFLGALAKGAGHGG
jgi:3-oxoadipate enol-lactonase